MTHDPDATAAAPPGSGRPDPWPPDRILVGEDAHAVPLPVAEALAKAGPTLSALHALWCAEAAACGDVPDRRALTPETLRPWLGAISIYEAQPDGDYRIKLDGTRIVRWTGEDWTGRRVSEVDAKFGRDLLGNCRRTWAGPGPALSVPIVVFQSEYLRMRRMMLPALSADRTHRQILMCMDPE